MTADKLKLFHEEIMQEEQINYSELPIIIKKQIKGFNLLKSKLEKKPDEKLFLMLQNRAIKIGDSIQNFVENDYEEEEEEVEEEVQEEEKPKQEVEKKSSEVKKSNTDNSVKKTEGDTEKKIRQLKASMVQKLIFQPLIDYANSKVNKVNTIDNWFKAEELEFAEVKEEVKKVEKPKHEIKVKKNKQMSLDSFF